MHKGIVIQNDDIWQGHPDVALFRNQLYVVYRQSEKHMIAGDTSIQLVTGVVENNVFSLLTQPRMLAQSPHRLNCPRLSVIGDELWMICDEVLAGENYIKAENEETQTRVFLWKTKDGENWEGPIFTNITGIVPDRICSTEDGFLIATHTQAGQTHSCRNMLIQNVWQNNDLMYPNWNKYNLAASKKYHFCEGCIFRYRDKLICLMRENSGRGLSAFLSVYDKDERIWSEPTPTRLFGCHRPVSGVLKSGRIFTTYREASHSLKKEYWAKNTFAHICDFIAYDMRYGILLPLDHDSAHKSDSGYTGWVQLEDESIFIVNYIVNKAPKPYIVWYLLREEDF